MLSPVLKCICWTAHSTWWVCNRDRAIYSAFYLHQGITDTNSKMHYYYCKRTACSSKANENDFVSSYISTTFKPMQSRVMLPVCQSIFWTAHDGCIIAIVPYIVHSTPSNHKYKFKNALLLYCKRTAYSFKANENDFVSSYISTKSKPMQSRVLSPVL